MGKGEKKVYGVALFGLLVLEPSRTAYGKVRAGWVCDHDIPMVVEDVAHVALVVWTGLFGR
jgi:hypothetical protein